MSTKILLIILFIFLFGKFSQGQVDSDSTEYTFFINDTSILSSPMILLDDLLVIQDISPELSPEGRKPLLLIHGWSFEGKPAPPGPGFWENFKNYILNDATLSANFKPYYVNYWSNEVSVKEIAHELRKKIEEAGLHEQKIAIVAHSMGGLVARSYMQENTFSQGIAKNTMCGDLVDQLITLGTAHHGSPMANGPARNAKFSGLYSFYMLMIESLMFNETKYTDVNRSDLRWDNYDNLFNYITYSDEANLWLLNLNGNEKYNSKIVCYTASAPGEFITVPNGIDEQYKMGAKFIEEGFKMENDGIVPVKSAAFDGHTVKRIRHFNNYNHADIIRGKSNKNELFDPLKSDLMEVAPLKITWPDFTSTNHIKHSQIKLIKWEAPTTVQMVNIYLSTNNGQSYEKIADRLNAASGEYTWSVPAINASNCLVKITNADFEPEASISKTPFTIFRNLITFNHPVSNSYFLRSKSNEIQWTQIGLGNKVKISYTDTKNGIEKLIANNVATSVGSNTFTWSADNNLPPTDQAQIKIELLNLNELYGDDEAYTFSSSQFHLLGDPNFALLSPETYPSDYFGIEGERVTIGSTYSINWRAEGEIKYIEFYLCDSNKQVISHITNVTNTPKMEVQKSTRWIVPEHYGDQFCFLARAGYAFDSILFEVYSDRTFRINKQTALINLPDTNAFPLQPCFEVKEITQAAAYEFHLQLNTTSELNNYMKFETTSSKLCLPHTLEYELEPGTSYRLMAIAKIGSENTFPDQITFKTTEIAPAPFEIIAPAQKSETEESELPLIWERAVGASSYQIEMSQKNQLLFSKTGIPKQDTTFILDISITTFYDDIDIIVAAVNPFGSTTTSSTFIKTYRNSVDDFERKTSTTLSNYPNPFHDETTIIFNLPKDEDRVVITLFDLTGKKLTNIADGRFKKGTNRVLWKRTGESSMNIGNGIYLIRLNSNQINSSKLVMVQ